MARAPSPDGAPKKALELWVVRDQTMALGELAGVADDLVQVVTHAQVEVHEVASPLVEHGLRCPDALFATFGESLEERIHVRPDSRSGRPGICLRRVGPRFELLGGSIVMAGRSPTHTATS